MPSLSPRPSIKNLDISKMRNRVSVDYIAAKRQEVEDRLSQASTSKPWQKPWQKPMTQAQRPISPTAAAASRPASVLDILSDVPQATMQRWLSVAQSDLTGLKVVKGGRTLETVEPGWTGSKMSPGAFRIADAAGLIRSMPNVTDLVFDATSDGRILAHLGYKSEPNSKSTTYAVMRLYGPSAGEIAEIGNDRAKVAEWIVKEGIIAIEQKVESYRRSPDRMPNEIRPLIL